MRLNGLVLAAGLSKRMGAFKPLLQIGTQSLLSLSVASMLRGGTERVTVVLGYRAAEARAELEREFPPALVQTLENPAFADSDMLASIKVGVSALPSCDAFYLLPGDMPAVDETTFRLLRQAMIGRSPAVVFPTVDGFRKHPPLICETCREPILSYEGTGGLRGFWRTIDEEIVEIPVKDEGCLLDADTPQDFERLSRYVLPERGRIKDTFARIAR